MTHRTKEAPKDFIRITLGETGIVSDDAELITMILEGLAVATAAGAHFFGRANLYLPIRNEKGEAVTRLGRGRHKLEDIVIEGPYRAAADEHKVHTIISRSPR
jgi:hypothetical protein